MGPEAWKRAIGEEAWNYLVTEYGRPLGATTPDSLEQVRAEGAVASVLTAATDVGFRAPVVPPQIDPAGAKVLWPSGAVGLTAKGLLRHWARRGHGFVLLRADALLKACAGPLLPRLQEVLAAYEEQCRIDGVEPLIVDWRVFVGGEAESIAAKQLLALYDASPEPDRTDVQRKTFQPKQRPG